ncbi:MAG TPA: hypothetical protein VGB20_01120 [bacterium]
MTAKPVVALDIGWTKVACAIGLSHERTPGWELLGSGVEPYPAPNDSGVPDPLVVARAIEAAIDATGVTAELTRALVCLSHPALQSERVRAAVPIADEPVAVKARDVARLRTAALNQSLAIDRDVLHMECLGYAGNGFARVGDPRGLCATRLQGDFLLVTMPVAVRRTLLEAVESVGLEALDVRYAPAAALAGAADERSAGGRVLVIDLGGLSIDLAVFEAGVLTACRVEPWGGVSLARDLARELDVTLEQATASIREGTASREERVRAHLDAAWARLEEGIRTVLGGEPKPDLVLVAGRAALMDGFVEWVERTLGIPTALCRSPRTHRSADLSRQLALCPAIGLLELASRPRAGAALASPGGPLGRVLERAKAVLVEYF